MLQKHRSPYPGFVPDQHVTPKALSSSFMTALLLAGTAPAAEAAVLSSIERLSCRTDMVEALLRGSVEAALAAPPSPPDIGQATPRLPEELGRVLNLSRVQRQCYVLRIMLGWPSEECARLVAMDGWNVDSYACEAAQALARMVSVETADTCVSAR
jgi:hypothetical protein